MLDELKGRVIKRIEREGPSDYDEQYHNDFNGEQLIFHMEDGDMYRMYHYQDCCKHVYIEDIIGDLDDLIGSPVLMAEAVAEGGRDRDGTFTWTFYKFATVKGYVTIRWYGSSNGYYSESVTFEKVIQGFTIEQRLNEDATK